MKKVVTSGGKSGSATNGTWRYLYDGWRCTEEEDANGDLKARMVWGNYLDELICRERDLNLDDDFADTDEGVRYALHNHLYSVHALTDGDGNIVEAYEYTPYGTVKVLADDGTDDTWFTSDDTVGNYYSAKTDFLFTGQRIDKETEWDYYKTRYYSAEWGRFISRDPIGYLGGLNLYGYLVTRPLMNTDAMG